MPYKDRMTVFLDKQRFVSFLFYSRINFSLTTRARICCEWLDLFDIGKGSGLYCVLMLTVFEWARWDRLQRDDWTQISSFHKDTGAESDLTACIQALQDLVLVASLPCGMSTLFFFFKSHFIISSHLEHTHTNTTKRGRTGRRGKEKEWDGQKESKTGKRETEWEKKREHQTQHWVLCAEVLARHTHSHTHRRWSW